MTRMTRRMLAARSEYTDARQYLGAIVEVAIDRPLGSRHPQHTDIYYPVNYGFVPGTMSSDGGELDAYVLGVFTPIERFTGRCIAIIHRTNDDDDKLIVVPDGTRYSHSQIRALTEFQERFFRSTIVQSSSHSQKGAIVEDGAVS